MCGSYCYPYRKIVRCSLAHREFAWIKKSFPLRLAYASYIIYYKMEEAANRQRRTGLME